MSRPQRCRRICREPEYNRFSPEGITEGQQVQLSIDEFEVIRLVDYEKKTHEQCAAQMDISRTTVTEIYETARYKIADCIINGKNLSISGDITAFATVPRSLVAKRNATKKQPKKQWL